jgi:hypothetical protein
MTDLIIAVLAMTACVYGASSIGKLTTQRSYLAFRDGLGETALVPRRLLRATAAVLAGGEATVAAGLVAATVLSTAGLPAAVPVSAAALACAVVLTGALAAGVTVVVRSGTRAACACFGARSGRELGGSHVARNLGLLTVLTATLIGNEFRAGRPAPAAALIAIVTGAVVALLVIGLDDIVALFAPVQREPARLWSCSLPRSAHSPC